MHRRAARVDLWAAHSTEIQLRQLRWLLFRGASTLYGTSSHFEKILKEKDPRQAYRELVPLCDYEDLRPLIMRMIDFEKDILWPGRCRSYAQSSGTSGGVSKYIPVTSDSLRVNHYAGTRDVVAQYLRYFPESKLFSGKAMILGGSFDSTLKVKNPLIKIGDLSATLIDQIPFVADLFRVPDKKTALIPDWHIKLDCLAKAAAKENITNISGVPSWFMRVILRTLELTGKESASELWPNLEVFFHGGISFEPYREEYRRLCGPGMNYFESYNASEGFFATQASRDNNGLLLLVENGVYYEFLPIGKNWPDTNLSPSATDNPTLNIEDLEVGKNYELIISSCNGLWRYRIGDTIKVIGLNPVRIRLTGRTKSFINAFGEELMEDNAEKGIAEACRATGARVKNYTAGPLYAHDSEKGRHQWAIEWIREPEDIHAFSMVLDNTLQGLNSDYAAKRYDDIFLDSPEVITCKEGTFDNWLSTVGSGKLGGQRKIPRLRNDRSILDSLFSLDLS